MLSSRVLYRSIFAIYAHFLRFTITTKYVYSLLCVFSILSKAMNSWYLLYGKPREELRAQQNLALQQIESYLPIIQQPRKLKSATKTIDIPLLPN